jgi:hypothetical protein
VGALLVSLLPRRVAREGAFVVAFINFIFSLHLLAHWNDASGIVTDGKFRFVENTLWLPQLGVNYHLGVDGISLWLVLLSTFLVPLVMLFSWNVAQRTKEFMVCLLLMEAAMIGVFCALDVILFYIFWEAVLIPTLLLIGMWGGSKRAAAGVKFFVYTMAGSVLMWVAMLWLYFQQTAGTRSFDYNAMLQAANRSESSMVAFALFGAFAIAFAIKAPLFPFHTWLPDTYAEAPTAASVLLAGVLSKMGIYGFIRFAIPFFPATARDFAPILCFLAIAGIIYGAFVAISQTDVKKSHRVFFGFSSWPYFARRFRRFERGRNLRRTGDERRGFANGGARTIDWRVVLAGGRNAGTCAQPRNGRVWRCGRSDAAFYNFLLAGDVRVYRLARTFQLRRRISHLSRRDGRKFLVGVFSDDDCDSQRDLHAAHVSQYDVRRNEASRKWRTSRFGKTRSSRFSDFGVGDCLRRREAATFAGHYRARCA